MKGCIGKFCAAITLLIVSAATVPADDTVITIRATLGGPTTFVLAGPTRERVVSSSVVIQSALVPALFTAAKVKLDLQPDSNVIKRVNPFELGKTPAASFYGTYNVTRIATQRNSAEEHLEVFLKKIGAQNDKAYNVYDPLLQHLLLAAFRSRTAPGDKLLPIDVQFDGDDIVSVTVGEKFGPMVK